MSHEMLAELVLARIAIEKLVAQTPTIKEYLTQLMPKFELVTKQIETIDEAKLVYCFIKLF